MNLSDSAKVIKVPVERKILTSKGNQEIKEKNPNIYLAPEQIIVFNVNF